NPSIGTTAADGSVLVMNAASAIRLDGGFVGAGLASTAAPQFRIDLPNTASASGRARANAWTTYSSRRWKDNIRTFDHALDPIARVEAAGSDGTRERGGGADIGSAAEDAGGPPPDLVEWEDDGVTARSLRYDRLSAVAIQGIKEQQRLIDALRADNAAL